jgi:hypothetical protein
LPKSFLGKEDLDLEEKLSYELPGILRLAIQHLQVLLQRRYFIQPETGKELSKRMTALSSPVGEFIKSIPPSPYATRSYIWMSWEKYCIANRQRPETQEKLWNDLESAGYACDFEAANILAKIREYTVQHSERPVPKRILRECSRTFHQPDVLDAKLHEMVKSGLLQKHFVLADNNRMVEAYSAKSRQFLRDETPLSPLPLEMPGNMGSMGTGTE